MNKDEVTVIVGWISAMLIAAQFFPGVYEVCVVERPNVLPFGTRLLSITGSILQVVYACLLGSAVGWNTVTPVLFVNASCLFSVLLITVIGHWKHKRKQKEFNYEEIKEPPSPI